MELCLVVPEAISLQPKKLKSTSPHIFTKDLENFDRESYSERSKYYAVQFLSNSLSSIAIDRIVRKDKFASFS